MIKKVPSHYRSNRVGSNGSIGPLHNGSDEIISLTNQWITSLIYQINELDPDQNQSFDRPKQNNYDSILLAKFQVQNRSYLFHFDLTN